MTEYKEENEFKTDLEQNYKLTKISEIQKDLEKERDFRAVMYKKYKRGINTIDATDAVLVTTGVGLGAVGMTFLANIITVPIALGLEAAAGTIGLLGLAGNYIRQKLAIKAKKHDEIRILARSKLNTISDYISKALRDGIISDEEFSLILSEQEKFNNLKKEIRSKASTSIIDEEARKELIQKGRELERSSIIKKVYKINNVVPEN